MQIKRFPMNVRHPNSIVYAMLLVMFLVGIDAGCQTAVTSDRSAVENRITTPVEENARIVFKGTVHPLANAANDRGRAPESLPLERIHLLLQRSDSQNRALHQLIQDMHTPGNASYHKWLTPQQFGSQFGPSDQDIATVESWLQSHGFSVKQVTPGKQAIEFSGNAGQFRNAFHAAIHSYQINGQARYSNASDPEIPAALAPVIGGFVALNNFPVKSYARVLGKAEYQLRTGRATPQWTYQNATTLLLSPADFAVQYDLNPLYQSGVNAAGQSIAIINEANINVEQVNQFRSIFGLPANPPQVVIDGNDPGIDGINDATPNYASTEAYLDVEWAGAVAPGATIYLVIAADSDLESGLFLAAERAVYSNIAPVISVSFGQCEQSLGSTNAFLSNLWEQAAAQGITVAVSSGDNGSASCDDENSQEYAVGGLAVNGLASTPYNVAVGGTDFYYPNYTNLTSADLQTYWNLAPTQLPQASQLRIIGEQPWNDSQYGLDVQASVNGKSSIVGGGGGASSCQSGTMSSAGSGWAACTAGYPKPAWQSGSGVPSDNVRDVPDTSLFAGDGANLSFYPICASDGDCQPVSGNALIQITGVGGTSATAPAFAGIMALVNQRYGRQGQAGFTLYPLKAQFAAAFHEITQGTNSVPCSYSPETLNCIEVANPFTVEDPTFGTATEGQLGTGTTPGYVATAGYNLATGLGSIDASQLVSHWGDVQTSGTTTTLTSSSNTFTHGTPITLSGSVTVAGRTPTGDVALMTDSSTPLQQGLALFNLINGSFSSSAVIDLPGGTYDIWGQYSGDGTNAPSSSPRIPITVTPEDSGILYWANAGSYGQLGWDAMSIPYGVPVVLEAQIVSSGCQYGGACPTATRPSGTVTFVDNGTVVGTAIVNSDGEADYTATIPVGSHSVAPFYSGDASYNPSIAPAVNFMVVEDTPAINLTINGSNSGQGIAGQSTVLTIQVIGPGFSTGSGISPTGALTLSGLPAGVPTSAALAPAVVPGLLAAEGVATVTLPANTKVGAYAVKVSYAGDSNYAAATASTTIVVASAGSKKPSSLTIVGSATSPTPSAEIQISGQVLGQTGSPAPTGQLTFFSSGYELGTLNILPPTVGIATSFASMLTSQMLFQGANLLTVQYSGDSVYQPSITTLNLANPLSDFTMIASDTNIPVSAGGSAAENIQLSSESGFAGTVSYTCSAAAGITCSLAPSLSSLSSGGTAVTALTVNALAATGAGSYSVLVTGRDSTGQLIHTLGLEAIVTGSGNPNRGFSLANSGNITVVPGASQISTLQVTPSGGFTGGVQFSCIVANSTAAPTCSAPSTTVVGAAAVPSTLTVNAAASTPAGNYLATVIATDSATGKIASSVTVLIMVASSAKATPIVTVMTVLSLTTAQSTSAFIAVNGAIGSPTPTGSVILTCGGYTSAATALNSRSFISIPIPAGSFAVGTDTLTATYTPDSSSSPVYSSASGSTSVAVYSASASPTIVATPSASKITTAQPLTVSVTVNGTSGNPTPTGSVLLWTTGYTATVKLSAGNAVFNFPAGTLAIATNTLTFTYTPDSASSAIYVSVWATTTVTVTAQTGTPPTMAVTPSASSIATAQPLTVLVAVGAVGGNPTPTGSVTLASGSYTSTAANLTGGSATFSIPAGSLATGTDTLLASYVPDASSSSIYSSISAMASITVTAPAKITPAVTVIPSASSVTTAQALTVTISLNGGSGNPTPTGSVTLAFDGYTLNATNLASGSATIAIPAGALAIGSDPLAASYTPDSSSSSTYNVASGSASVTVTAPVKITPAVTVTPSASSITTAQAFTVTISLNGGSGNPTPTGSVTLAGGGYTSNAATLASGSATIAIPAGALAIGSDSLAASYTPDSSSSSTYNVASGSASVTVTAPVKITPTVAVTPSASSITTTQALTVTISLNGGSGNPTPTGSVTLAGGGYTSKAATLSSGSATIAIPAGSLAVGTDTMTASYTGDATYGAITGAVTVTVAQAINGAGFTVSGTPVTVTAGATTANTSTITVTPVGSFIGNVALTAAVTSSPANAQDPPVLSFASASELSMTYTTAATTTLIVSTTAGTNTAQISPKRPGFPWYPAGGASLACILLFSLPVRRRSWQRMLGMFVFLAFLAGGVLSCSSSITFTGAAKSNGTTPGTYTVTLTGVAGSTIETNTVAVTVE